MISKILLYFILSAGFLKAANLPLVTVDMTDNLQFFPQHVTIASGQTILWRNRSRIVHTVTADSSLAAKDSHVQMPQNAKQFNSGSIPPGQTYQHTFTIPGEYRYFCIPHEMAGMIGSITVETR